jgi:prophage regulatory protein
VKFLTFAQLKTEKGVPYTRRHLRDLVRDGKFPKPVELSEARIAWIEDEVDAWQATKAAQRDADRSTSPTPTPR